VRDSRRLGYVSGAPGSGKTSLAVPLAAELSYARASIPACSQRIAPEQPYQRRRRGVPTAMQPPRTRIILNLSSSS
jgi:predicted kinase